MRTLALAALLALLAVPSLAAPMPKAAPPDLILTTASGDPLTNPWYSLDNLTIAAGASYGWWAGGDAVLISPRKEFVFGLYNAFTLTQHVDAILNVEYGVDSKIRGFKLGARYILKSPK